MKGLGGNTRLSAPARPLAIAIALCGVQFVDVLGVTVVVTALPQMLRDVGATAAEGTLVVTAYAMFFGGLLLVASRVGDRVGHRRVVLTALALFTVASAVGALAGSAWVLAAARALQGTAAAASVPSALRLLTTLIAEGPARRRAVAGWSAAGAAAGASGFVVGGVLTEVASWRAAFWATIALAVLLAAAVLAVVPPDRRTSTAVRMAWPSAVLLTGGAMAVVGGTTLLAERHSAGVGVAVTAAGILAAVGFVLVERRAASPLLPPAASRTPALRWGALGSFLNTATTSSSFTVATLYLQGALGRSPLQAAALLVSFSVFVVPGSVAAPRLVAALGHGRALACGLAVVAAGNALLLAWPRSAGIAVAAAVCGFGIGVGSVAATDLGTDVDDDLKGTAAGALNTAAQLGTAIGTAMILLVVVVSHERVGWAAAAALAAVGALVVGVRGPRPAVDRFVPFRVDRGSPPA